MKKKIILLISSILIAFIASIIVDRLLGIYLNKTGYFKAMVPNVTKIYDTNEFNIVAKTSSQGIRNEEVVIPKPKGVFRILTLGDSFTYGWGVELEKSWPKLLEKNLKVRGKKIEVINAGNPGVGPNLIKMTCQAYEARFKPDLIIYGLFTDDLYQAAESEERSGILINRVADFFPTLTRIRSSVIFDSTWKILHEGERIKFSEVWKKTVKEGLEKDTRILLAVDPNIRSDFLQGKINPGTVFQLTVDPDYLNFIVDKERFNYSLMSMQKRLALLRDECTKKITSVVVFIPSPELVSSLFQPFFKALGYKVDQRLSGFELDIDLGKVVTSEKFTYISPLSQMRQKGCEDCYYKYDLHLNNEGHEQLAKYVYPKIQKIINDKTD